MTPASSCQYVRTVRTWYEHMLYSVPPVCLARRRVQLIVSFMRIAPVGPRSNVVN